VTLDERGDRSSDAVRVLERHQMARAWNHLNLHVRQHRRDAHVTWRNSGPVFPLSPPLEEENRLSNVCGLVRFELLRQRPRSRR
jgi:hypothetical protein